MRRLIAILLVILVILPTLAHAANLRVSESIVHGQSQTVVSYVVKNDGVNIVQSIRFSVICRPASGSGEASYTVYVSPNRLEPGTTGGANLHAPLGTCDYTLDRKITYFEGEIPARPPGAPDPFTAGLKTEPF